MKYIRTADGRILDLDKIKQYSQLYQFSNGNHLYVEWTVISEEIDIIKQADTIEELCDEFVMQDNDCKLSQLMSHETIYMIQTHTNIDDIINDSKMQNYTIFGAIWTDKGLIYVAKMNEKGDLELL